MIHFGAEVKSGLRAGRAVHVRHKSLKKMASDMKIIACMSTFNISMHDDDYGKIIQTEYHIHEWKLA